MTSVPLRRADSPTQSRSSGESLPALPLRRVERTGTAGHPERIGRFTLLRPVARGGMGQLYLAASGNIEGAERPVVVKTIRADRLADASFVARFLDEARVQAQLNHPAVPQVFEAALDAAGAPYVVMEYVEGRCLAELSARARSLGRRLEWPDVVAIGVALSDALAYVHSLTDAAGTPLGIVHRDLSPQNVMVAFSGELKLIDFGTACGENRRSRTVGGVVLAKPGYAAPEVGDGDLTPAGTKADLYGLGVLLWEFLAGRRFLQGEPAEHLCAVRAGRLRPEPVAWQLGAPPELDRLVQRLTAREPGERPESAAAALASLSELLREAPALPSGERSLRRRLAELLRDLFPGAQERARGEFQRLLGAHRVPDATTVLAAEAEAPPATEASRRKPAARLLGGTRYELLGELGRGASSVVFEARHVDLGRHVALKVVPQELARAQEANERFRCEGRTLAALRTPHVVGLYDCGVTSDGRLYLALERLEGRTLEQLAGTVDCTSWVRAAELAVEACRGLEAIHAAGVVHRDVKPANLWLEANGRVRLLDFGIAAPLDPTRPAGANPGGRLFGTPEYMAPEQAAGADVDATSDLYALGVVLYELIAGALPHDGATAAAVMAAKMARPPAPLAERLLVPRRLDAVVLRALAARPGERWQTALDLRLALEAVLRLDCRARRSWHESLGALLAPKPLGAAGR